MATKKKAKGVSQDLANIVSATTDPARGFLYVSREVYEPLVEQGLVEVNGDMVNENGEVAARATQIGVESVDKNQKPTKLQIVETSQHQNIQTHPDLIPNSTESKTQMKEGTFQLTAGIPVPSVSGRGRKGSSWPFDEMEVTDSFFVPNTEDRPNAAKSMASSVSAATARYAEVIEGQFRTNKNGAQVPATRNTREFTVRAWEENGVKGARIWRTA